MRRWSVLGFGLAVAALAGTSQARGGPVYVATDRFGYTGPVTRYNTLGDAQTASNPLASGSFTVGQRVFSVTINTTVVEPAMDIVARYGADTAGMRAYQAVSNGNVTWVNFCHVPAPSSDAAS